MKTVILILLCISFMGLMVLGEECRTSVGCGKCRVKSCEKVNCPCGTYKDKCKCCDLCRMCAGQLCGWSVGDICQNGYYCAHVEGTSILRRFDSPGTCKPLLESPR